jgi:hypothetical protein
MGTKARCGAPMIARAENPLGVIPECHSLNVTTRVVGKEAVTRGNSLDRKPLDDFLVLLLGVG